MLKKFIYHKLIKRQKKISNKLQNINQENIDLYFIMEELKLYVK